MRTPEDALRSVKRYVAEVLSPQPSLCEVVSSDGVRWTAFGWVAGAISVDRPSWQFLVSRNRTQPAVVGSVEDPIYYLRSVLKDDAETLEANAAAIDPYIDLRVAELPNTNWALPLEQMWEVRLAFDYGEVPEDVPFARVGLVGGLLMSGAAWRYDVTQPMTIECMLPKPDSSDVANLNAVRLMDTLNRAFRGPGVGLGRPIRIPLWDYTGVGLQNGATYRHPSDYLRVLDFSPRLLPDPMDVRKVPVVADLRVGWRIDNDVVEMGYKGTVTTEEIRVEGVDELFTEGVVVK